MSKPPKVGSIPAWGLRGAISSPEQNIVYVSNMKNKYYFKLKDNIMLITRCCVPRTCLGTYKLLTDDFPIVQAF